MKRLETPSSLVTLAALWRRVTAKQLAFGLGGVSIIVMFVGTCAAYSSDAPLPPPRDPPPKTEALEASFRYKEGFYRAQVDEDCDAFKVPRVSFDRLKKGNRFRIELKRPKKLRVGRRLRTRSLALRVVKRELWLGQEGKGMRAPHLALSIVNRTRSHLAYRIVTSTRAPCRNKTDLAYNAIALEPKQRVTRTECLLKAARGLVIKRIETLKLTPIGYHYVSRLDPLRLRSSERISAGHTYASHTPCRLLPWREIRDGMAAGETRWVDVVDFYARHNCDEYTFFTGYKWAKRGFASLPVKPPGEEDLADPQPAAQP